MPGSPADPSAPTPPQPTPRSDASGQPLPTQRWTEAHDVRGGDAVDPSGHFVAANQWTPAGWIELRTWSEQLEDILEALGAACHRAHWDYKKCRPRPGRPRTGIHPETFQFYIADLVAAEKTCAKALIGSYRRVVPPEIIAWQQSERGIGPRLTARLLGHLGDPCIAVPHWWEGTGTKRHLVQGEPYVRTVSQLWQYAGVGDPHRKRRKGMTKEEAFALGNPDLKKIMYLHADACVKAGSGHYREVYDKARALYEGREHATECVRCGPAGRPAKVGSPWAKGHQYGAALRKVSKEILRDLWRVRHANL